MPPFDPERDQWSNEAIERLFPSIALQIFKTPNSKILYAWNDLSIDRMDKDFGTDAVLKSPRRNVAVAIRLRGRYYYESYGDITIRYDSMQTLGKMLEIQKSIARFMFYAWGDTNSPGIPQYLIDRKKVDPATIRPPEKIVDWNIVRLQELIDTFLQGKLKYRLKENGDGSSRLLCVTIRELDNHGLIYQKMGEPTPEQDEAWERSEMLYEQKMLFEWGEAYQNELRHAPWVYD